MNLTTTEETQETLAVQRAGGAGRQEDEHDTLDWAAMVTSHAEDRTEDMDLSTDNLSEVEGAGRPGKTQDKVTSRTPLVTDESSADVSGQGENQPPSQRQAGTDEWSRTETAKNRASGSKKNKLEPGSERTTEGKRSRNRTAQKQTKCEPTWTASPSRYLSTR
jgi:hypothetical protein